MPDFTPSPWAICEQNKHLVHSTINGRAVALAVGLLDDEQRANARLIAAAPEMYRILCDIREWCEYDDLDADIEDDIAEVLKDVDGTEDKS